MTKEERIEHWQRIITEQEESGMTPRTFCLNNHINLSRFYHWRLRFRRKLKTGFVQLIPAPASQHSGTDTGIRIHLNTTVSIELAKGFDPSALRCVIDTLSPCRGPLCCP
jgi:hypothetical protein